MRDKGAEGEGKAPVRSPKSHMGRCRITYGRRMHTWYIRPGATRMISLALGLYWTISSAIGLTDQPSTSQVVFAVLGVLIGLAFVATVLLSMRFDRRPSRDSGAAPDPAST